MNIPLVCLNFLDIRNEKLNCIAERVFFRCFDDRKRRRNGRRGGR